MGCAGSSSKDAVEDQKPAGGGDGGYNDGQDDEDYQPLTQEEVNARIQCSDGAHELYTLGKSGITLRYAYLSQRGYYPEDLYKANQDAFKVIPAFNGDTSTFFMGVFDGHGSDGDACSYFVRDNIEEHLKATMQRYPDDFEKAFKHSFLNVNKAMHDAVRRPSGVAEWEGGRALC